MDARQDAGFDAATITPVLEPASRLLASVRRNPALAPEIMTIHAQAAMAPKLSGYQDAHRWGATTEEVLRHSIARAARRAARDGAVTGTAFVVGYPAALASLYLTQSLMLLEIAAAHGHDASDPLRAAEILVIRGRHKTVGEALTVLDAARRADGERYRRPAPDPDRPSLRHPAGLVRFGVSRLRQTQPLDLVLGAMGAASFVIPLVGVPACSYEAARATRRLGLRASAFYASHPGAPGSSATFALPPAPTLRARILSTLAVLVAIALGVALSEFWVLHGHEGLWRLALAGLWACVLAAHVRLGLLLWRRRSP